VRLDLHCHSNHSDGSLSALELIQYAQHREIELLSITDHDNIDVYDEILNIETDIKIISGIEFSTTWNKIGIHVVGLNFDLKSAGLKQAISSQTIARMGRAKIIGKRLEKLGIKDTYKTIITTGKKYIGRPDFAQLLVKQGHCKDINSAFKKYLGAGKIGDVKNQWLTLKQVIDALKQASGMAVLAHPLFYRLTNSKLNRLIQEFKGLGGDGIEIVNGFQNPEKTDYLIMLCKKYNLLASMGSDFHSPSRWKRLGCDTQWLTATDVIWDKF